MHDQNKYVSLSGIWETSMMLQELSMDVQRVVKAYACELFTEDTWQDICNELESICTKYSSETQLKSLTSSLCAQVYNHFQDTYMGGK